MRDQYSLDRRANALYDAAMASLRAAIETDEDKHWQLYARLMYDLEVVYAEMRRLNADSPERYRPRSTPPIATKEVRARAKRRRNEILEMFYAADKLRAYEIINAAQCAKRTAYEALQYWRDLGLIETDGVGNYWAVCEDDSA